MSSIDSDTSSPRKQSWNKLKGRLLLPVGAIDYAQSRYRAFRTSTHTTDSTDSSEGAPDIDETYLGGELPEDPFSRGPVTVLGRRRTTSLSSMYNQRSHFIRNRHLTPLSASPSIQQTNHGESEDVFEHSTFLPKEEISISSRRCSILSAASFYTCPSTNSESNASDYDEEMDPSSVFESESITQNEHFMGSPIQPTSHEIAHWQHLQTAPISATDDSKTPRLRETIIGDGHRQPASVKYAQLQFERFAAEELSPLCFNAATIAFQRRASANPIRRATSTSACLPDGRRAPNRRACERTPCSSRTLVGTRPPSYSSLSGRESVPPYRI
ncbi:hypothetical protein K439DRAFT_1664867 [Ramaria rubella]|nr:hypothetical protein K439DRAFT_1664867 [Ramaria rubella]